MILDYESLKLIWWLFIGVLLIGFAVTDGFDLGVGTLLPFVARDDVERRIVINTIGPVWEGNQVWLVLGGGAIFAAWPHIYAMSFSGFYLAMFATLFALILRPVGFKYRSKHDSAAWRSTWEVESEIAAGRLVAVLEEFAAPPNGIYVVFPQRKHLPLRVRTFIDQLKNTYGNPAYWGEPPAHRAGAG